ncbi:hypothetical protein AgCh_024019 [Apium graveolens]
MEFKNKAPMVTLAAKKMDVSSNVSYSEDSSDSDDDLNETSIIVDTSKYIADLKQKVDRLNQDIGTGKSSSHNQTSCPVREDLCPGEAGVWIGR